MRAVVIAVVQLSMLLSLFGCAAKAPQLPVEKKDVYIQDGAKVYSPEGDGWQLASRSEDAVIFTLIYPDLSQSAAASARRIEVSDSLGDNNFYDSVKQSLEASEDRARYNLIESTYEQLQYKQTRCLKYKHVSEDYGTPDTDFGVFSYLKTFGYVCRLESERLGALQMAMSHRSGTKAVPYQLRAMAERFFNAIMLTP